MNVDTLKALGWGYSSELKEGLLLMLGSWLIRILFWGDSGKKRAFTTEMYGLPLLTE
jgi:hypothetical protein